MGAYLSSPALTKTTTTMAGRFARDKSSLSNLDAFRTSHIALNITVDFGRRVVAGSALLDIHRNGKAEQVLVLDTRAIDVKSVSVNESETTFTVGEPSEAFGSALTINLPSTVEGSDSFKVLVEYATTKDCTAVQWLSPEQTAGKKHPYMFTQCQAIHARSLLPCQDSPSQKITYDAKVTIADPLVPLMSSLRSNPDDVVATKLEDGTPAKTYTFNQPESIPSYLIALAAGNLVSADIGPRSKVWTEPEMLDACVWEFEGCEKFIESAEKYLPKYAWGIYDLLVLPGSFPYGGMENPCLTFVTPTLLAGDRSLVDVVAHEISHSWCGNLVTSNTWESFWLNEGWTVYVERLIVRELHGEDHRLFSATIGWRALQDSIDQFGAENPLTALVPALDGIDPDDSFSSVPYEKGFNLLYHLENLVGFDKFTKFMKVYVESHAGQSISTQDFRDSLAEYFKDDTESVEKLNAVEWDKWLFAAGMPPIPAMPFKSKLVDDVHKLVEIWDKDLRKSVIRGGEFPYSAKAGMEKFSSGQKVVFLEALTELEPFTSEVLNNMDEQYGFTETQNCEVLFRWLMLLLHNGVKDQYEPRLEVIKSFLARQGRMKYTRPLYRSWFKAEQASGKIVEQDVFECREYFKSIKNTYHPICAALVAKDLKIA